MSIAYKVVVTLDVGQGCKIQHEFEKILDTDEEAREFGERTQGLIQSFQESYETGA